MLVFPSGAHMPAAFHFFNEGDRESHIASNIQCEPQVFLTFFRV
jgi:hypothetical protein